MEFLGYISVPKGKAGLLPLALRRLGLSSNSKFFQVSMKPVDVMHADSRIGGGESQWTKEYEKYCDSLKKLCWKKV